MDRADKFINNRAPRRTVLLFIVMLGISAVVSFLAAGIIADISAKEQTKAYLSALGGGKLTAEPTDEQLTAGEKKVSSNGISRDIPPQMVAGRKQVRNAAFAALFALSGTCSLVWMILRLRGIFTIYDDLEAVSRDCTFAANRYDGRVGLRGEDMSCVRRVSESADLLAQRMTYLGSRYEEERLYLSEFLGDLSHQIKISLAVVRLNTDILTETEELPRERRDELGEELQLNLDGMEALVVQAIKLARLEADTIEYDMREQPLADTCERALRKLAPMLRDCGITVKRELPSEILLCHDRNWLCEAVENILKNSADHSGCTELTVSIETYPAMVKLIITDNGIGIPQQDIPKLFERFAKKSGDRTMKSAGLGMSIARKIVNGHGGEIMVYSKYNTDGREKGSGTRFELVFLN